jgi:hypothetical protein
LDSILNYDLLIRYSTVFATSFIASRRFSL